MMTIGDASGYDTMMNSAGTLIIRKLKSLNVATKVFLCLLIVFYLLLGVLVIIISPARIAQYLYDQARILAEAPFGSLALALAIGLYTYIHLITATHILLTVCISFPPLVGHTTLVTLCGFAYGMNGIYIAATASIFGSALVFVVLRFLFSARLRAWSEHNQKWQALESVVVRSSSSIPYTSNNLVNSREQKVYPSLSSFAYPPFLLGSTPTLCSRLVHPLLQRHLTYQSQSIEAVKLWQFVVATFFIIPKLLLHTFIGSKIAQLSDGDQRGRMDTRKLNRHSSRSSLTILLQIQKSSMASLLAAAF